MKLSITHIISHLFLTMFLIFSFCINICSLFKHFMCRNCTFCHLTECFFSLSLYEYNATENNLRYISFHCEFQLDAAQVENELDYFVWMENTNEQFLFCFLSVPFYDDFLQNQNQKKSESICVVAGNVQ